MGAILEREGTLRSIEQLLDGVRAGQGHSLFIVGDPGLGKTTMLEEARRRAASDFRLGRGLGDAAEASLPFGIVDQALRQLGFARSLEPAPPTASGIDVRSARFYAILRFLELPADKPALLLLDDLHWADDDSLALLAFLCRRIRGLPVGVIAALRAWPRAALDTAIRLANSTDAVLERISPLSAQAATALIAGQSGTDTSAAAIDRAARLCAGNPLLLEQVAFDLRQGRIIAGIDGELPSEARRDAYLILLSRFAGMTSDELRMAQAGSIFGSQFLPSLAAEVADLTPPGADRALEALAATGLIRAKPGGVAEFLHPLVAQVLYEEIPAALRARWHAAAFAALVKHGADPAEAAEHALQADVSGDPEAVNVLRQAGFAASAAGAVLRARRLYERAAELAGTHASVDLLLELGTVLLATGAGERAIQTFRRVMEMPATHPRERIAAQRMLGRALYSTGHPAEASVELQAATEMALHSEPAQAIEALLEQVFIAYFNGGPAHAAPFAERARELAVGQPPALRMRADTAWAFCAFVRGDMRGIPVIEDAARTAFAQPLADTADYAWSWGTLGSYANMAKWSERFGDACNAYEVAMHTAERLGSPVAIAQLAVIHGDTCLRMGKLADALKLADRASSLSELAPETAFWAAICHGYALAEIGRMEECRSWCDQAASQVLPDPGWVGYIWLWHLQAVLAMHARDTVAACQLFERIEAQAGRLEIREPCVLPWRNDAVRAYLYGGKLADATRVVESLEALAKTLPCKVPRMVVAASRAALAQANGDQATALGFLRNAVDQARDLDLPVLRARVLHQYGAYLRRGGELRQARGPLAEALELAEAAGAESLARKIGQELAAAGGRRRLRRENPDELTVQETRVAALAAEGLSNQQVAQQLFVSVDTVETHLQHIYRKLDIGSRKDLIRRFVQHQSQPLAAAVGLAASRGKPGL